jgi:hypothetical protein
MTHHRGTEDTEESIRKTCSVNLGELGVSVVFTP